MSFLSNKKAKAILAFALIAAFVFTLPVHATGTKEVKVQNKIVRLATTTSTENSGLLGYLLPIFTKDTGYEVHVVAVGTGAALKLGENADADVVLVHARSEEDKFMAAGHGTERRDVMYNDFIVLGPKNDPAGIAKAKNAVEAFAIIAKSGSWFVSRGDRSGTHVMELDLWNKAGVSIGGSWYKEAGQGMEQVILMSNSMGAYTLSDRGTWIAVSDKTDLAILYQGDPVLFNPYGIITVNPDKSENINYAGAKALLDWMTSDKGQKLIAGFQLKDQVLFFPNYKK
ncbi:substrate-binding domain-containing protein [Spirochaetota bacterium]